MLTLRAYALPEAAGASRDTRWHRRWLALIVALGVGTPLLVAALTGNLTIPHNDSWAATRITQTFWHTGQIRLLNYNDMSLIGQLFLVGPLGTSLVAQQIGVAIVGAVTVWCCYELTAAIATPRRGLLAAALLVLWPGFASLTTSFMTDIPALAASWAALLVGRRALDDDSRWMFALSLALGFWGLTVREVVAAAPAAVVLIGLWTHRARVRVSPRYLASAATLFILLALVFFHWRDGLPNGQDPHLAFNVSQFPSRALTAAESIYFTLAVFLAPIALLMARPWRWQRTSWLWVTIVAAGTTAMLLRNTQLTVGGYFGPAGEYSYVMPLFRHVIPTPLWDLVTPIAVVSGLMMAGELAENWRRAEPILTVFTGLSYLATVLLAVGYTPLITRYLLPMMPGAAALLLVSQRSSMEVTLRPQTSSSRELISARALAAGGLFSLLVIGVISVMLALNAFAFDHARWIAATRLVASSGIPADRVDGGPEWDGWHSPAGERAYTWVSDARGYFGLTPVLYPLPPCAVMTTSPLPPGNSPVDRGRSTLLAKDAYHTFLVSGESHLYVYKTHVRGCAARS